jgi:hypothetical protein
MKIYRSHDSIAPIVANLQTIDDPGGMNPWVVGLVLIGAAIALWWPNSPLAGKEGFTGEPLMDRTILVGFGLALMLVGVSILSRRIPALAKFGSRHRMAIIVSFIAAVAMTFAPLVVLALVPGARVIGLIIVAAFIINFGVIPLWVLQRRNARRVAAEMRKAVSLGATPIAVAAVKSELAHPGELAIELYEKVDLPEAGPLRDRLSTDRNIDGKEPCRFLHLYNFFADAISAKPRNLAAWRLHGPVMMLASPLELARAAGYKLDLARSIESQLLHTQKMIEARVDAMSDAPLPGRSSSDLGWLKQRVSRWMKLVVKNELDAGLPELFAETGAYREEVLLCTDQTWQSGVQALTDRADKVIMDASDFNAERRGLVWEIQHVLNHFATEDMVVLVNSFTDLPELGKEFRQAWANMPATSPNNRRDEARLRIVLLIGDDKGGWDDDSSLGGRSVEIRDWERIAAHHRIVELLCGTNRDGINSGVSPTVPVIVD